MKCSKCKTELKEIEKITRGRLTKTILECPHCKNKEHYFTGEPNPIFKNKEIRSWMKLNIIIALK